MQHRMLGGGYTNMENDYDQGYGTGYAAMEPVIAHIQYFFAHASRACGVLLRMHLFHPHALGGPHTPRMWRKESY